MPWAYGDADGTTNNMRAATRANPPFGSVYAIRRQMRPWQNLLLIILTDGLWRAILGRADSDESASRALCAARYRRHRCAFMPPSARGLAFSDHARRFIEFERSTATRDAELAWLDDPVITTYARHAERGRVRACVAPEVGGALAAFYEITPDGPLHWLRPAVHRRRSMNAIRCDGEFSAASLLQPHPRRAFRVRRRDDRSELAMTCASLTRYMEMRGGVRGRSAARTESAVKFEFEHDAGFEASGRLAVSLSARSSASSWPLTRLRITMSAHNLADRPMPFGMGHHPYYPRTAQTRIHADVQGNVACRRRSVAHASRSASSGQALCATACRPMRSISTTTSPTGRARRRLHGPTNTVN